MRVGLEIVKLAIESALAVVFTRTTYARIDHLVEWVDDMAIDGIKSSWHGLLSPSAFAVCNVKTVVNKIFAVFAELDR